MPKLGDAKECRLCGEGATLKLIPASSAAFSEPGAVLSDTLPEHYAWECVDCGDREPFNGTLDPA